jgi:3-oxoacyl-[acyl-carrier-protein] synthase II
VKRIVLTGVGPLTSIGAGKKQFWDAILNGFSGIKKITKLPAFPECYGGEISDINFDEYIPDKKFRRAADISRYTMLAVRLAIDDANPGSPDLENLGIIASLTHGALNHTQPFHRSLIIEGVESVSPILFCDSMLNAPAGNTSIGLSTHGPVHTLVGGRTVSTKAIMLAAQMIHAGTIDRSIIVSAEEYNELSFSCYSRLGFSTLSEGAGALFIENENTMKGTYPYCFLLGIASRSNPSNLPAALNKTIEKSLEMAMLKIHDIDLIMVNSSLSDMKDLYLNNGNMPARCMISLTGSAFSVTTMWDIIVSALMIKYGIVPSFIINKKENISAEIKNIMICVTEREGAASTIILSKYP